MDNIPASAGKSHTALGMYDLYPLRVFYLSTIIHHSNFPFIFLFIFRYLRLVVHLFSFWVLYKSTPVPANPTVTPENDVTVIIPTVEPENTDFRECLTSVIANRPAAILIVTVGRANLKLTRNIVAPFVIANPHINFQVTATDLANKRRQVCHAIPSVHTSITILVDDHVFWPSQTFLRTMLAPFEDPTIGCVGTNKRVRRFHDLGFGIRSFWNMIGAIYLERHNFEIRATNAMDGGVFVISGRTSAHRTCILQDPKFIEGFTNEMFFFGKFGPLNADDDNFITRWEVSHGWKIKIQYCPDALIETTLGTYPKFLSQCLRWVRTTWRSNSASLFTDRTVWYAQPWCVYAVYITSFFNFALFTDACLFYLLSKTTFVSPAVYKVMAAWIFAGKMGKLTTYFLRNPSDLIYLPGYFVFAYYHSLIKLYAGLTFWVTAWGGRDLSAVEAGDDNDDDKDDGFNFLAADDGTTDFHHEDNSDFCTPPPVYRHTPSPVISSRGPPVSYHKVMARSTPRAAISTPWGRTTGVNPHLRPANVLESSCAVIHPRYRSKANKSGKSVTFAMPLEFDSLVNSFPQDNGAGENRKWTRVEACGRLHEHVSGDAFGDDAVTDCKLAY